MVTIGNRCFSKQAYVIPLKDKTARAVVDGFKLILTKGKHPKLLQPDKVQSKIIIISIFLI